MQEKKPAYATKSDQPTRARRVNKKLLMSIIGVLLFVGTLGVVIWMMRAQRHENQQQAQLEKQAKEKQVIVDQDKATKDALNLAKKADEKKPKPSVVKPQPKAPQPKLQPILQTKQAFPSPGQPTQPMMQPAQIAQPNPWKQARQTYIQQQAQRYYQMRAQARVAPMKVFGSSTQVKSDKPPTEKEAFLKSLSQVHSAKPVTPAMAQVLGKPVQSKAPTPDANAAFFGQPMAQVKSHNGSTNVVMTGTVVSVVLETGLDSQLPGMILGVVASPVYDPTMTRIVIPSGAKLVGQYNPKVQPGQTRAQVRWSRLVLPGGQVVALPQLPGVDFSGYSGMPASVNEHWGRIALGASLSAVFSGAAAVFGGPARQFTVDPKQQALYGAYAPFQETGQGIAERFLKVDPTLTIEAGALVGMLVTQDLVIPPTGGQ